MFIETPRFPEPPSYGVSSAPIFSTSILTLAGGQERRNQNWATPLRRYSVTIGPRQDAAVENVLAYFSALGGQVVGFRFKDYADFRSAVVGADIANTDQPLADLGNGTYQLMKAYSAGSETLVRLIQKPVAGTIVVANESAEDQPASRWSLDTTTGILTPNGTFVGTPTSWGGEFDVPVRFDGEVSQTIDNLGVWSIVFSLMELRV